MLVVTDLLWPAGDSQDCTSTTGFLFPGDSCSSSLLLVNLDRSPFRNCFPEQLHICLSVSGLKNAVVLGVLVKWIHWEQNVAWKCLFSDQETGKFSGNLHVLIQRCSQGSFQPRLIKPAALVDASRSPGNSGIFRAPAWSCERLSQILNYQVFTLARRWESGHLEIN